MMREAPSGWPHVAVGAALEPIQLFDLAARQVRWLSASQSAVADNIANANTPGFHAKGVQPFSAILDKTALQMVSTNTNHIDLGPAETQADALKDNGVWETTESGNSVSIEQEMIKAGEIHRDYAMNTGIMKAFHGMLMASVKV